MPTGCGEEAADAQAYTGFAERVFAVDHEWLTRQQIASSSTDSSETSETECK
jgi:hypothetical protein